MENHISEWKKEKQVTARKTRNILILCAVLFIISCFFN